MRQQFVATLFATLVSIAPTLAADYPTKPITFIVPAAQKWKVATNAGIEKIRSSYLPL